MDRGTYIEIDGHPAVRFERTYRHPPERVWAAITDPAELKHWFPSAVRMDPQVGGRIEFWDDPNLPESHGTVLTIDPPRRLSYSWGGDELRFELEPAPGNGCTLVMINLLEARNTAARNAAGWSVCLAAFDKLVDGTGDGVEDWKVEYDAYVATGMPSGAEIPGA